MGVGAFVIELSQIYSYFIYSYQNVEQEAKRTFNRVPVPLTTFVGDRPEDTNAEEDTCFLLSFVKISSAVAN